MSCLEKEHSSTNLKVTAGLPVAGSFSGVASPKFERAKFLTLSEKHYFCLGRLFSKHKTTRHTKNFGEHGT